MLDVLMCSIVAIVVIGFLVCMGVTVYAECREEKEKEVERCINFLAGWDGCANEIKRKEAQHHIYTQLCLIYGSTRQNLDFIGR